MTLTQTHTKCYHCGDDCQDSSISLGDKSFCCQGCKTVYEILNENDLCTYYDLNQNAGVSLKAKNYDGKFDYLEDAQIQSQLLDYQGDTTCKITFFIPEVHCSSCVWLLENFNKIQHGVIYSRLDFLKKELSLTYNPQKVSLKNIVELLTTLGYEPLINLESADKQKPKTNQYQKTLLLKIAVTGFCMGNIMIFSFPEYFHLETEIKSDAIFQNIFLYLNLILSLPVFFFGASDYLNGALVSLKEFSKKSTKNLSVDIPIALGISALFLKSVFEVIFNHSAGYFDSLAGLVFFLLVGKWVQQKTFDFLSFRHQYQSYFPLAVKVLIGENFSKYLNINELKKGDLVELRNQEIIPADSILKSQSAQIDYSFVTGESALISKQKNVILYAGGRISGEKVIIEVIKPVSQSYLTQLWNDHSFKEEKYTPSTELADKFSKYFTFITILIASFTAIYWYFTDYNLLWSATVSVLMVACPCALTLSMPFTMNVVMVLFGKNRFYVRNQGIIQLLNEIDTIVFDKTGTLTESNLGKVQFNGSELSDEELASIRYLMGQSTHPLSRQIEKNIELKKDYSFKKKYFFEIAGQGIEGVINRDFIKIGKLDFVKTDSVNPEFVNSSEVHISINNQYKGYFSIEAVYRENWQEILKKLSKNFDLVLLSGDNEASKQQLSGFFKRLFFNQKPQDKLDFIKSEQQKGRKVLMIGDGLNDAGALRQANVGIAIRQDIQAFTPSCDAILDASRFTQLADFMAFSRKALNIVKLSFLLSLIYNFIGIGWAVSGQLSPVLAAIFMPLSSLSVVLFSIGVTFLFSRKIIR
jgi:P-type Cu+ transporter